MVSDMDARFQNVAPIALLYSETSSQKNEVSNRIRKFYFGDGPIDNGTEASVVKVSCRTALVLVVRLREAPVTVPTHQSIYSNFGMISVVS
jgi:hypothetical protein